MVENKRLARTILTGPAVPYFAERAAAAIPLSLSLFLSLSCCSHCSREQTPSCGSRNEGPLFTAITAESRPRNTPPWGADLVRQLNKYHHRRPICFFEGGREDCALSSPLFALTLRRSLVGPRILASWLKAARINRATIVRRRGRSTLVSRLTKNTRAISIPGNRYAWRIRVRACENGIRSPFASISIFQYGERLAMPTRRFAGRFELF